QGDAVRKWTAEPPDPGADWAPIPATGRVVQRHLQELADLRCACAALALERYRRKHHRWPDSLQALVQAGLLESVPHAPYTGGSLRLRGLGDGLVVFSVGPDREDNEGAMALKNPMSPGTDIGFRPWNVPRRRQPASLRPKEQDP